MLTDIEIAQQCKMKKITEIAEKIDIPMECLEPHGWYKAKVNDTMLPKSGKKGKLILVTAITPTPAGEGKTTVSIGLADAMQAIGKKVVLALREPSLGPVFGVKGGAAGGGYSQLVPMEDINLHFNGDLHALTAANNLLAAMLDNHIHQGNSLVIDSRRITWKRCMDMNDRQLRFVVDGLGGDVNGVPREDGFDITAASEMMAVLCLADGFADLKKRISEIVVAYNYEGMPVTAKDLNAVGAIAALLKDAIHPNLVQSLEHTPAIVHGGPFANIAHGCNTVAATNLAMRLGDYAVTEAGFGADLGAEKFLDIKCRKAGLKPSAVVMVATVRALKMHGGVKKEDLNTENLEALKKGMENLFQHIDNIKNVYKLPCVVAINEFPFDTEAEKQLIIDECAKVGTKAVKCSIFANGSKGGIELAKEVVELCDKDNEFTFSYEDDLSIKDKIKAVAKKIYHGNDVNFTVAAEKKIVELEKLGYGKLPVCISKTQYSFSDDPLKLGAPKGFNITVRDLKVSAGAGFIVVFTGNILSMPGLPKRPAAEGIDIDDNGVITGLF